MTTEPIRLYGDLLAALDDGSLSYKLLPFGEPGSTNKGKLTVPGPGIAKLPADPSSVHANYEHDFKRPLGKAVALEERADGVYARFMPADTTAGRDWREEAKSGLRRGISVELANPVIRNGVLLAGELTGAGAVVKPAYASALLVAADAGEDSDALDALTAVEDAISALRSKLSPDAEPPASGEAPPEPAPVIAAHKEQEPNMSTPPVPRILRDGSAAKPDADHSAGALFAALENRREEPSLLAAFSTVQQVKNFDVYSQPAWVGEINAQKPYVRQYADLILNNSLTSQKVKGWKFVEGKTPQVRTYSGNFAEIHSNPVELVEVEFTAGRVAGGNKVDRIHHDFPDAGFWAGYLRESAADYDVQTDQMVLDMLVAGATPILANATPPAGVAEGWVKLVRGVLALRRRFNPSFALIGDDLFEEMLLTTDKDKFAFLNATLGWSEGQVNGFQFRPAEEPGAVVVGAKESAELQELPGLIRVSALDVSHAATDEGVYGYNGAWVRDARALVSVVDTLPVP